MKKTHIFALIIIAIACGIILSTAGDASTYVTFAEAETMASKGDNSSIHVVGTLKKSEEGEILGMEYRPEIDPNYFQFTLLDNDQKERVVVLRSTKPQDFDKSEQVVVIGRMEKNHFEAEKILLKCPSKYNNGELEVTEYSATPSGA
jgi:cytochrome c-type biogenesis protein CcmE